MSRDEWDIREIKAAWRRAYQARRCPPLSVLKLDSPEVHRHLASCSDCRERLEAAPDFTALGELLFGGLKQEPPRPTRPKAGEIRQVITAAPPASYFDEEGGYYNPPEVLVLDDPDESGLVRVAQIFYEAALALEDDVDLDDGSGRFAQSWNVYGLSESWLSEWAYSAVSREVLAELRLTIGCAWPELDINSPIRFFRMNEADVGSRFAWPSVLEALAEFEALAEAEEEAEAEAEEENAPLSLPPVWILKDTARLPPGPWSTSPRSGGGFSKFALLGILPFASFAIARAVSVSSCVAESPSRGDDGDKTNSRAAAKLQADESSSRDADGGQGRNGENTLKLLGGLITVSIEEQNKEQYLRLNSDCGGEVRVVFLDAEGRPLPWRDLDSSEKHPPGEPLRLAGGRPARCLVAGCEKIEAYVKD